MWQTRLSGEICYSDSARTADSKKEKETGNRKKKQKKNRFLSVRLLTNRQGVVT